jgi:predicted phage gp36 major capsid-like protein
MEQQTTDHDNLITIIEQVKNLTKSQMDFHAEMRRSFENLQNNYSGRLDRNEARIKVLEDDKIVIHQTLKDNKNYLNFLIGLGLLLLGVLIYHLTGFKI